MNIFPWQHTFLVEIHCSILKLYFRGQTLYTSAGTPRSVQWMATGYIVSSGGGGIEGSSLPRSDMLWGLPSLHIIWRVIREAGPDEANHSTP
jgi:hypothetical protein